MTVAPSFLKPPKEKINFVALFITIALGVAAGNLMSNWITAKVVEYQTKQALIEFSEETDRATQESRARNAPQIQLAKSWPKLAKNGVRLTAI